MAAVDSMAAKALRCLALAQKTDLGALSAYDGDSSHPVCDDVAPCSAVIRCTPVIIEGYSTWQ